ncbi:MAG TPA: aldehyde dehydrogenase family protein, partial [Nordella sp.]|nr:aldehyde dehydrogenase family protein [Nordella sp.]
MDNRSQDQRQVRNFIGGEWVAAKETMTAINPATGEAIASLPKSNADEVKQAVAAAKAARAWAETPVFQRAQMCVAIASAIDAKRDRLARTLSLEQGKILKEATGEVAKAADGFRLAAELVKQMGGSTLPTEDPTKLVMTIRQPRGVYGVITPWNFPVNIPVEYLAPGIATGNTIVWVPAPTTSLVAADLMAVIAEAGLPAGVVNLVIGEGATAGDAVVTHPDVVAIGFTGSAATGRRI